MSLLEYYKKNCAIGLPVCTGNTSSPLLPQLPLYIQICQYLYSKNYDYNLLITQLKSLEGRSPFLPWSFRTLYPNTLFLLLPLSLHWHTHTSNHFIILSCFCGGSLFILLEICLFAFSPSSLNVCNYPSLECKLHESRRLCFMHFCVCDTYQCVYSVASLNI